jgi:microcystin-dependent protein
MTRRWITGDNPPANSYVCRRLMIPDDLAFLEAVNGALLPLLDDWRWEQIDGDLTPAESAAYMATMFYEYLESNCMLGAIFPYATIDPPAGCLPCDGSTYADSDYPKLAAILDPVFDVPGGFFKTPDLRDQFVLGAGGSVLPGGTGGAAEVALTAAENGQHTHTTQAHTHTNTPHTHTTVPHTHTEVIAAPIVTTVGLEPPEPTAIPSPGVTGPATVIVNSAGVVIDSATVTVDDSGDGDPHENMPPYTALKYCIVAR